MKVKTFADGAEGLLNLSATPTMEEVMRWQREHWRKPNVPCTAKTPGGKNGMCEEMRALVMQKRNVR